jgi:hypothetical protein
MPINPFTPFFTGHINWIASSANHFWYLYIRVPKMKELYQWPELVYTNDVPRLSKSIEELITADNIVDGISLHKKVNENSTLIAKAG